MNRLPNRPGLLSTGLVHPRKGTIAVGSEREVTGWPVMTLHRGEVVHENGEILAGAGSGELLRRSRWQAP